MMTETSLLPDTFFSLVVLN